MWLAVLATLLFCSSGLSQRTVICRDGYSLRNEYCYRYYQIVEDYSAANRSCARDGASLIFIDSAEEDQYVRDTFFTGLGETEFWIGLNDMETEGIFRWATFNGSVTPSYVNWAQGDPVGNSNARDCVKYASDGWRVHSGLCSTSRLHHICKLRNCESVDGVNCLGSEPETSSGVAIGVIVIILVVVIVIILVIVIALVLLGLWKFNNDVFQRYCCCCLFGGSKTAVHSMQQENQRLRRELSQHKISMSGRYQPGQLGGELSGVPDGRGGVLPTIKRPLPGSGFSPVTEESRMLGYPTSPSNNAPPPLVPQRPSQLNSLSRQSSSSNTAFFFGNPSTRPMRQSLPANFALAPTRPSVPAPVRGVAMGGATTKEDEKYSEDSGSDSNESDNN